jgi:hypothetical protein
MSEGEELLKTWFRNEPWNRIFRKFKAHSQ